MIEGLWSISFSAVDQPQDDVGAGVVVFETLRVFGGDSIYFYTGNYSITSENQIKANVSVNHYFGPPLSIFGPLETFTIILSGAIAAVIDQCILVAAEPAGDTGGLCLIELLSAMRHSTKLASED